MDLPGCSAAEIELEVRQKEVAGEAGAEAAKAVFLELRVPGKFYLLKRLPPAIPLFTPVKTGFRTKLSQLVVTLAVPKVAEGGAEAEEAEAGPTNHPEVQVENLLQLEDASDWDAMRGGDSRSPSRTTPRRWALSWTLPSSRSAGPATQSELLACPDLAEEGARRGKARAKRGSVGDSAARMLPPITHPRRRSVS